MKGQEQWERICLYLKKDNSIKYKEAKSDIESFFNNLVTNIVNEIENDNQSEDW